MLERTLCPICRIFKSFLVPRCDREEAPDFDFVGPRALKSKSKLGWNDEVTWKPTVHDRSTNPRWIIYFVSEVL